MLMRIKRVHAAAIVIAAVAYRRRVHPLAS
jgi:hypothetical protein